jgi:hypothetical protein
MLEKTEGAIKNEQSRDNGNIEHTRHTKQNKNKQSKTQNCRLKRWATRTPPRTLGLTHVFRKGHFIIKIIVACTSGATHLSDSLFL